MGVGEWISDASAEQAAADSPCDPEDMVQTENEGAVSYLLRNQIALTPGNRMELRNLQSEGMGDELVAYAVDEACAQGKPTWEYVRGILCRLLIGGIQTAQQALDAAMLRKQTHGQTSSPPPLLKPLDTPTPTLLKAFE